MTAGICQAASRGLTTGLVLRQPVGGRAAGLGAFTAVADGPAGFLHNPAGAGFAGETSLGFDYTRNLAGNFGAISAVFPAGHAGFGAALLTFQGDSLEIRPTFGERFTVRSQVDYAGILGAGHRFGRYLSLGGSFKGFRLELAGRYKAAGVAGDAGFLLSRIPISPKVSVSVGGAATNIGPHVKFLSARTPIPFTLKAGAGLHVGPSVIASPEGAKQSPSWTLSAEYRREVQGRVERLAGGLELRLPAAVVYPLQELSFRAGAETGDGPLRFQAGLGLRFGIYGLDYALRSAGQAGQLHQMSFSVLFGEKKRLYRPEPSAEPPKPKYGKKIGTVEEVLGLEEEGKFLIASPERPERLGKAELLIVGPRGAVMGRAFILRMAEEVSGGFLYEAVLADPGSTVLEPGDSVHLPAE